MKRDIIKDLTPEQTKFLLKIRHNLDFYNSLSDTLQKNLTHYLHPYVNFYGPTGTKILNEIREEWLKYKKGLDNSK